MPFIEYMLLALLGSPPAPTTGGNPSAPTFTAESIAQPSGAATGDHDFNLTLGSEGQAGGGTTGHARNTSEGTGKEPLHHTAARHHRRHHRTGKVTNTQKVSTRNAAHKG